MADTQGITPRSKDFSEWYLDIIREAKLAETSPVRGCMVFRPDGFALWEAMREDLDRRFKDTGHVNAYFPLLIPKSFLAREAEHVDGFAKECAIVTHHRLMSTIKDGKPSVEVDPTSKLEEELIIRPTSETIIWHMYSKWIQSYRDLPILINQWANVMRWEMRTRPFLRTAEFLWQEGHTAHATAKEAIEETERMLEVYRCFSEEILAMPVVTGRKTAGERFPGAVDTMCIEALMQDGKALQAGTSHFLGQNFAKAFDVTYLDQTGQREHVWATSWGVSTRLIGAVIMTHSDDTGLVLPPKIAPTQVVIVPILKKPEELARVMETVSGLTRDLKARGVRVHTDDRDTLKPGAKFFEWERRGVPLRIEIGPRDIDAGNALVARRDWQEGMGDRKATIGLSQLVDHVTEALDQMQTSLLQRARVFQTSHTFDVNDGNQLAAQFEAGGFVRMGWDGSAETEAVLKEKYKATIRCIPLEGGEPQGRRDPVSGKPAVHTVMAARAY